jgi:hypothetical protein
VQGSIKNRADDFGETKLGVRSAESERCNSYRGFKLTVRVTLIINTEMGPAKYLG